MPRAHVPIPPGTVYHRLTVLQPAWYTGPSGRRTRYYWCQCVCGETKMVLPRHLRKEHTQSCGCWRDEVSAAAARTRNRVDTRGPQYAQAVAAGTILSPAALRALRRRLHLSQQALADSIGVTQSAIGQYERGILAVLNLEKLTQLTAYLHAQQCAY